MLFSLHKIGKCWINSFGETSEATTTSFATHLSTDFVTSFIPLSTFPDFLAFSTMLYTFAILLFS